MDGARNDGDLMQQQDPQHRHQPPENHAVAHDRHRPQRPPPPSCPRCDSSNTKFCYYNNYSLSQPRYFCKACRRYWTQGGALRTVPIGGGCRKPKRQKTPASASAAASPSPAGGFNPRTQGLSAAAAAWSQNLFPSPPPLPATPPVVPPLGGSFFAGGGSSLSALAAMQSFPVGRFNHGAAAMPGGGGRFGSNMALLQGMTFPSLKSPAPPPTRFFPPQQSYVPPLRFSSWPQSVINTGGSSSSAGETSGFRSSGGANGGDQAAPRPSFTPNQWSDSNLGFNPSE